MGGGRVDGFVRMEGGYEVVLCEFERGLDVVRITWVREEDGDGYGDGKEEESPRARHDEYYKAIAARYDGIGGGRVALDYEHFVTAYTYLIDLFHSSSTSTSSTSGSKMAVERSEARMRAGKG